MSKIFTGSSARRKAFESRSLLRNVAEEEIQRFFCCEVTSMKCDAKTLSNFKHVLGSTKAFYLEQKLL